MERDILVDNYSAQVRAHSQNLISIALLLFFVATPWALLHSLEEQGVIAPLLDLSVATLLLLFLSSALIVLFSYMFGRMVFWSQMASWVLRSLPCPPPEDYVENGDAWTTLAGIQYQTLKLVKRNHRMTYRLFKVHSKSKTFAWFFLIIMIYLTFLSIADIPKYIDQYWLIGVIMIGIGEIIFWRSNYGEKKMI